MCVLSSLPCCQLSLCRAVSYRPPPLCAGCCVLQSASPGPPMRDRTPLHSHPSTGKHTNTHTSRTESAARRDNTTTRGQHVRQVTGCVLSQRYWDPVFHCKIREYLSDFLPLWQNNSTYLLLVENRPPVNQGHQQDIIDLFVNVSVDGAVLQPAVMELDDTGGHRTYTEVSVNRGRICMYSR